MGAYDVRLRSPGPAGITSAPLPVSLLVGPGGVQHGLAVIHDEFNRPNTTAGAVGREDGGKLWATSSSYVRSERLVTPGGVGYTSLELRRTARRMLAGLVFTSGTGTGNSAGLLVSDVMNVAIWNAIGVYFSRTVCQVHVAANGAFTQVGTNYTYTTPCVGDNQTVYQVGWTLTGDDLVIEMPDGTTQVYTDVRFASPVVRGHVAFHHSNAAVGNAETEFDWVTVDPAAVTSATTTEKGVVKLAGDLAGTADAPTVPTKQSLFEKNLASGYPGLSPAGLVNPGQLGTGTRDATRFLRDDSTWQPVPSGYVLPASVIHDDEAAVTPTGAWTFPQPVSMPVPTLAAHPVRKTEFDPVINTLLPAKEDKTQKGVANGYASLNATATVPLAQLATGTPTASAFVRGDGTWAAVPTGDPTMVGDITGTASANQIAAGVIVNADVNSAAAIGQSKIQNLQTDLAAKAPLLFPFFTSNVDVAGGVYSNGTAAGYVFDDRLTNTETWSWYANAEVAYLWNSVVNNVVSVSRAGNITTPSVTLSAAPTLDNHAARKGYVDTGLAAKQATSEKDVANGYVGLNASVLVPPVRLGTGTPTASVFLRGDSTWASVSGGDPTMVGDITGTASANQIAAGVIVNADVNSAAAISQSKIQNLQTDLAAKAPLSFPIFTTNVNLTGGLYSNGAAAGLVFDDRTTNTEEWSWYANAEVAYLWNSVVNNVVSVSRAGNITTPSVTLSAAPTLDNHAARKGYVDTGLAAKQDTSTKNAANGYPGLNASSLIALTQLGTGTPTSSLFLRGDGTWATVSAAGDPAMGGDLSGPASNAQIVANAITNVEVSTSAAIAESKLSLATDAAANVGSRRTLGTGALQAAAGSDLAAKAPLANAAFTTNVNITGGLYSNGATATITFDDRTTNTEEWSWYANAEVAYLYNSAVGIGNVVSISRAGNITTPSVTLSAAPTLDNHAARKGYVDTGLAAKQATSEKGVANGYPSLNATTTVPVAQLGTGTPTSSLFLRGDGVWATPPSGGGGDPTMGGDLTGVASAAQIAAGAIVDADVNAAAAIAQSKILNLTTDLAAKQATSAKDVASGYPGLDVNAKILTTQMGFNTPSSAVWLRGNGNWATPVLAGDVTGSIYANQIAANIIVDADVNTAAAIAQSKILNLTTDLAAKQATSERGQANGYPSLSATTTIPPAQLATGTPTSSLFVRGDGVWATPPGGGGGDPTMGGDLTGLASNAQIAAGVIVDADVHAAAAIAQAKIAFTGSLNGLKFLTTPVQFQFPFFNDAQGGMSTVLSGGVGRALLAAADPATAHTTLNLGNSATRNVGTTINTVAAGDDSRFGDATTTTKGIVQLAGDLSGTAAAPTVPGLAGKQSTTARNAANGYAGLDGAAKVGPAQIPFGTAVNTVAQGNGPFISTELAGEVEVGVVNTRIGVVLGTPRLLLESPSAPVGSRIWEIDNNAGTLRFFVPGNLKATLDVNGTFSLTGAIGAANYQSPDFTGPYMDATAAAGNGAIDLANRNNVANNVVRILGIGGQTGDLLQVYPDGANLKARIDKDGTFHGRAIYGKASNNQTFDLVVANSTNVNVPLGTDENAGLTWTFSPNYEWQIVTPGLYYIEGNATWGTSSASTSPPNTGDNLGQRSLAIFKNGVTNLANNTTTGTGDTTGLIFEISNHVSCIERLVAGDKINLVASSLKGNGAASYLFNHGPYSPNLIIIKVGN